MATFLSISILCLSTQNFQLKFAKAGEDLSTAQRILHETSMNTQSLQQRFNRLCAQFRRLHVERGQAVSFWESTLRSMKQRDDDIREVAEVRTFTSGFHSLKQH